MEAMPTTTSNSLADISLPDSDDNPRRIGDLWHDNPVVFIWLRHYG
jgi:hypothetical protein